MEQSSRSGSGSPPRFEVAEALRVLSEMATSLASIDVAIARLQAVRESTLAFAGVLAEYMAQAGEEAVAGQSSDDGAAGQGARAADSRLLEMAQRAVAAELATATRTNDRVLQRQMGQAAELLGRFRGTFDALADGEISLNHARVVQDTALDLPHHAIRAFEKAVLPCARSQATARLKHLAAREAECPPPEALPRRHERAKAGRRVCVTSLGAGMSRLAADMPSAVAAGIHERLTRIARTHLERVAGEGGEDGLRRMPDDRACDRQRTLDQLRADALADLLLRGAPESGLVPEEVLQGIAARVEVTVPVLTLMGVAGGGVAVVERRAAAELSGRHPIDPDRKPLARWQVVRQCGTEF